MNSSSSILSHLFLPPPSPPQQNTISTVHSTLPSPPRPRRRRKNHLRPKIPAEPPQPTPLQELLPLLQEQQQQEEPQVEAVELVEEFEREEELVLPLLQEQQQEPLVEAVELVEEFEREEELVGPHSAVADPFPDPAAGGGGLFLPGELLGLALRFAALLAVQTAVAVWFLGRRERAEEARGDGAGVRVSASEEVGVAGKGSELQEFEKAVSEIREMAREAREVEAKEAEEEAMAAADGVKGEVGRGIRKPRKSRTKRVFNEEGPPPPPPSSSSRRKKGGPVKSKSRMLSVPKGFDGSDSRKQDADVVETVNNYPKQIETQSEKSFKEGDVIASTMSTHVNGRSMSGKDDEEESNFHKCKDSTSSPRNIPWWTKLPYVLAILLHRRSDHNGPKGLYSLKMDSPSEDEGPAYYTVVFQDQGDATNFCYLLESFFADLDDFVADVVPLEIHELEEGVRSNAIKVIVVKKGQVQFYAGQPLTEVETVLRSLVGKQEV